MFLLNIYFIANRTTFNFEFLICHMTTWFNGHLVLRVGPLYFPSLGALGLDEEEILRFIFFVTSQEFSDKESCYSMGGILSRDFTTIPSLVVLGL